MCQKWTFHQCDLPIPLDEFDHHKQFVEKFLHQQLHMGPTAVGLQCHSLIRSVAIPKSPWYFFVILLVYSRSSNLISRVCASSFGADCQPYHINIICHDVNKDHVSSKIIMVPSCLLSRWWLPSQEFHSNASSIVEWPWLNNQLFH